MHTVERGRTDDLRVWPANLPAGARWLPYNPEPAREPARPFPPQAPAPPDEPERRSTIPFWRLLLVASITAGFVGILGGTAIGLILGIR